MISDCKFCGVLGEVAAIIHDNVAELYCVSCKQKVIRDDLATAVDAWNVAQQELKAVKDDRQRS